MEVSRRQFLTMAVMVGLTGSLPAAAMKLSGNGSKAGAAMLDGSGRTSANPAKGAVKLADLHKESFHPLIRTAFQVTHGAIGATSLVLDEIIERGQDSGFEQYSLIFSGPREPFFPQGIYEFQHSGLGGFSLFLVPIGQTGNGFRYQAVFNRPRK
jgi:hypothetical protein